MGSKVKHFTVRVGARADLARTLKEKHLPRVEDAGITVEDLDIIITEGEAARAADREQHDELATNAATRKGKALDARDILSRETLLRERLPAVIGDIAIAHPALARWLAALTFARYRLRNLPVEPSTDAADAPEIDKVERLESETLRDRLSALANFCTSITKPGREPIVDAFTKRKLTREQIIDLGEDAAERAKAGSNVREASASTQRESAAVIAQEARWNRVSRMVRRAAADIPDVAPILAQC